MDDFFYLALAPWLVFCLMAIVAKLLINFAKKRRGLVVAFGVFVQIFMPDPLIEKTMGTVIVEKRPVKKATKDEMSAKNKLID